MKYQEELDQAKLKEKGSGSGVEEAPATPPRSSVGDIVNVENERRIGEDGGGQRSKNRRKNQSVACCFCKKRRKRCDGGFPTCSACMHANIQCTFIDRVTGRELPRDYIQMLESRLRELDGSQRPRGGFAEREEKRRSAVATNLHAVVSHSGSAGSSSTRSNSSSSQLSGVIKPAVTISITESNEITYADGEGFEKPSLKSSLRLLKFYQTEIQCQYPFLDWPWVVSCFDKTFRYNTTNSECMLFAYLIMAIGNEISISKARTGKPTDRKQSQWSSMAYQFAMSNADATIQASNLRTIQFYLLLIVYSQIQPTSMKESNNIVWIITGLAMRTAVSLELHRKPCSPRTHNSGLEQHVLQDLRSKVFWSAYSLERISGLMLGRPFCISDVDIDAPLPESEDYPLAIALFKLRRIQSSICTFVYGPRKFLDNEDEINQSRQQIVLELEEWKQSFTPKNNLGTQWDTLSWCHISYHISILWLLRPVLLQINTLKKDDKLSSETEEWLRMLMISSSELCFRYNELKSLRKIDCPLISINSLYVAGITFLYYIWLDLRLNIINWDDKSPVETIRNCSNALDFLCKEWPAGDVQNECFKCLSLTIMAKVERNKSSNQYLNNIDKIGYSMNEMIIQQNNVDKIEARPLFNDLGSESDDSSIQSFAKNISGSQGNSSQADKGHHSLWSFLNSTGDTSLRDMIYDMLEESD